jgi:undecaprenyl diphosphate synthase
VREPSLSRVYHRSNRAHELTPEERAVYDTLDPARTPQHVAIIMDGNGRWAGKRALKRFLGHQQGAECVQFVVETASRIDLPWITLYAFSLENNLRRPKNEVNFLMKLLRTYLISNVKRMNDNNIRMAYIGRTHELPQEVQDTMQWASDQTAKNTGTTLTLALNYGARSEIVDAARTLVHKLIAEAHQRGISVEDMLAAEGVDDAIKSASTKRTSPPPSTPLTCPTRTSSSAPPASSASPTSCYGKSPTPRSLLPTASGRTSAVFISLKPSPTTSSANAASEASVNPPTNPSPTLFPPPQTPPPN